MKTSIKLTDKGDMLRELVSHGVMGFKDLVKEETINFIKFAIEDIPKSEFSPRKHYPISEWMLTDYEFDDRTKHFIRKHILQPLEEVKNTIDRMVKDPINLVFHKSEV